MRLGFVIGRTLTASGTGFYSIPKAEREQNKVGVRIYRIYEHGEALAYVRLLMKFLYPVSHSNPQIIEARYNFVGKDPVSQHNMINLANHLKQSVEKATS